QYPEIAFNLFITLRVRDFERLIRFDLPQKPPQFLAHVGAGTSGEIAVPVTRERHRRTDQVVDVISFVDPGDRSRLEPFVREVGEKGAQPRIRRADVIQADPSPVQSLEMARKGADSA